MIQLPSSSGPAPPKETLVSFADTASTTSSSSSPSSLFPTKLYAMLEEATKQRRTTLAT